jgi:hypothetical protein
VLHGTTSGSRRDSDARLGVRYIGSSTAAQSAHLSAEGSDLTLDFEGSGSEAAVA